MPPDALHMLVQVPAVCAEQLPASKLACHSVE